MTLLERMEERQRKDMATLAGIQKNMVQLLDGLNRKSDETLGTLHRHTGILTEIRDLLKRPGRTNGHGGNGHRKGR